MKPCRKNTQTECQTIRDPPVLSPSTDARWGKKKVGVKRAGKRRRRAMFHFEERQSQQLGRKEKKKNTTGQGDKKDRRSLGGQRTVLKMSRGI